MIADDWLEALLNCVLVGAILFYSFLPILGLATWHNVVPEHDHFVFSEGHHPAQINTNGEISQATFTCVRCNAVQTGINVLHVLVSTGSSALFGLSLGLVEQFTIPLPALFAARLPAFVFHLRSLNLSPLDPPPTNVAL